ncbi:hypothetical protein [Actinomadura oligospora]|uniref:hypothetical protein n=1 Tax=Actinomadura oligospora TaxID=111804 RepID=UPI0004B04E2E|nr:hypothetical protein [Actinomadura oligospora]
MDISRVPLQLVRLINTAPPSPVPTTPPALHHDANGAGGLLFLALVFGLVLLGSYLVSIRRHPYRACRACRGTGKKRSSHFSNAFRACDACGGTARQHRPGATRPYRRSRH